MVGWPAITWTRARAISERVVFRIVSSTLVKASKACAPRWFFEHCETFLEMTAGRRSRSARLLVGSIPGL
jgi:hypothetical protein